jgi:RNA polymerase sigma-70 factor (ECF subfamily)
MYSNITMFLFFASLLGPFLVSRLKVIIETYFMEKENNDYLPLREMHLPSKSLRSTTKITQGSLERSKNLDYSNGRDFAYYDPACLLVSGARCGALPIREPGAFEAAQLTETLPMRYTAGSYPSLSELQKRTKDVYSRRTRKQTVMSEDTNQAANQPDAVIIKRTNTAVQLNGATPADSELRFIERLRNGDENAFLLVIQRYHHALLRLAMIYVPQQTLAEEVVQETWMGVLQGLKNFEGRSSLKTWIFRILTNCAKTCALREGRSIPFSSLFNEEIDADEPSVNPERFFPPGSQRPGTWISLPENWDEIPEKRLLSQETFASIDAALETLPPHQRIVITLHDIEGWMPEEICSLLGISEANRRVLLHRARSKVRHALERYFHEEEGHEGRMQHE